MIITLENGNELRGDLVKSAILRNDLSPVPVTLEAEIRLDDGLEKQLAEGKLLQAHNNAVKIIKATKVTGRSAQGQHGLDAVKIIALLDQCHQVAFVKQKAIIKNRATLKEIYQSCGARLNVIDNDLPVSRFACPIGGVPTFHIARALQEEGGVVRWKNNNLTFFRLTSLFKQNPVMSLPNNAAEDVASGFLERHQVPFFVSLDKNGGFIQGEQTKARIFAYAPFKSSQQLNNMSRCLVQRKISQIYYSPKLCAGDLIDIEGYKALVIVTAAHVLESGTDGESASHYSKLWLSSLEG